MGFDCCAYGLRLESSFELVGVGPGPAESGEAVVLGLESPAALSARWSGAATEGAWRGRLRDGAELTIRWGRAGELLFSYDGDRARFLLDPEAGRLGCAPRDPDALDWQRVLLSRVLPLVAIARGAEALHAGAVDTAIGAVAVLAPSGGGKSTLVAELIRRGNLLLSDDVVVLRSGEGGVRAHPASAHLSLATEGEEAESALGELGGKRWLLIERLAPTPRPVAALVLLERGSADAPRVDRLPASPLPLAPFMLGLPDQAGRDASRFDLYADLVAEAPLLRLTAAIDDSPAALAAELELALAAAVPAGAAW